MERDYSLSRPAEQVGGHHAVEQFLHCGRVRQRELPRLAVWSTTDFIVGVPPPPDRPELTCPMATELLSRTVFLPCYPEMSDDAIDGMCELILGFTARSSQPRRGWVGSHFNGTRRTG